MAKTANRYVAERVAYASPLRQRMERQRLEQSAVVRAPGASKYVPHVPTARQSVFLGLDCMEALYGGAAAGGKSDALLMAALEYVHVPGYAAMLFRRTFTDLALPNALIPRAQSWLAGTDAKWNDRDKTWRFPSGATLTFGYLDGPNDHFRYQGAELQFIGCDELTQFRETQYRYMFSRLRRLKTANVPLRVRNASNPGGTGHDWVKQRFIHHALPGPKGIFVGAENRIFVPAKMADNPYVDVTEYERSLANLDPTTRLQLAAGDWDIRPPGQLFKREWFAGRIVPVSAVPVGSRPCWFFDLAGTEPSDRNPDPDWTAGCLAAYHKPTGAFYIVRVVRFRLQAGGVEARIDTLVRETRNRQSLMVRFEQEPGSSGKSVTAAYVRRFAGFDVAGVTTSGKGTKTVRATPFAAQAQAGNVYLCEGAWHMEFLDELESVPDGAHDDQMDAAAGAFNALTETTSGKVYGN